MPKLKLDTGSRLATSAGSTKRFVNKLRTQVATADTNRDNSLESLICEATCFMLANFVRKVFDSVLHFMYLLGCLVLPLEVSEFDVPHLSFFCLVDYFAVEHCAYLL